MRTKKRTKNNLVLFGGGRAASERDLACSRYFARALVRAGHVVSVGCASGVDAAAIVGCLSIGALPRVFAVFAKSGQGSWRSSATKIVQAAAKAGAAVIWSAGGSARVPFATRLMRRSLAALAGCGLAVFFAPGRGSLQVARAALRAGVPVLLWRVGLPAAPALQVKAQSVIYLGFNFWLYQPGYQPHLF